MKKLIQRTVLVILLTFAAGLSAEACPPAIDLENCLKSVEDDYTKCKTDAERHRESKDKYRFLLKLCSDRQGAHTRNCTNTCK